MLNKLFYKLVPEAFPKLIIGNNIGEIPVKKEKFSFGMAYSCKKEGELYVIIFILLNCMILTRYD